MSNIVQLDNLSNEVLRKRLASQIALMDWIYECSKCGYPRLLHKDYVLYREPTCTQGMEVPNILRENWKAYTQRVKPILRTIQTEREKEIEQGTFLKGIEKLMASNTESISGLMASNRENMKSFFHNVKKREHSPSESSSSSARPSKLTKPAKVPS